MPVEHQAWCLCEKCSKLPLEERAAPHTYRIRRRSKYPDSKTDSARYANQVVEKERQRLRSLHVKSQRKSVLSLEALIKTYFELNPRKVSAATIERDLITRRTFGASSER